MNSSTESAQNSKLFKRKPKFPAIRKSLAFFLVSLQGIEVVVELKNDKPITGILQEVDKFMNLVLINTHKISSEIANDISQTSLINGSTIRYVHIPKHIKPRTHISEYIRTIDRINVINKPRLIKDKVTSSQNNVEFKSEIKMDIILN